MVVPAGFPQPLDTVTLLCCAHAGPPPLFEQTSDRRDGVVSSVATFQLQLASSVALRELFTHRSNQ